MYRRYFKRIIDFCVAFIALVVLLVPLIVVALCLSIANRGAGVFFFQERPGLNERIFRIVKFKTMTDEKGSDGCLLPDAQRITKVGRIVRALSIDELPQLWNVLKGDMSLVGPRPLLTRYLGYYTKREQLRHTVRPGITGWAQVNGRNLTTWDERLEKDAYYVENLSFLLDLRIVLKTITNVVSRKDVTVVVKPNKLDDERRMNKKHLE